VRSGNFNGVADRSGGNIVLSWDRILGEESGFHIQTYFDRTERSDAVTAAKQNIYDLEFNHFFNVGEKRQINWGLGYRRTSDEANRAVGSSVDLDPTARTTTTWSGFLQDEITLIEDTLTTVWGAKVEHNSYTGWEFQPSARLAWTPDYSLTLWGAVSTAIRSPSRVENDFNLQIPTFPAGYSILGNSEFQSESLTAYELGFRKRINDSLIVDTSFFYNHYDDLRSIEFLSTVLPNTPPYGLPPSSPIWIVNQFGNSMKGSSYGVEIAADWQVNSDWSISTSYSWLKLDLELDSDSTDALSMTMTGNNPEHQFQLQSMWNVSPNLEFDTSIYYVSHLQPSSVSNYTRVDLRLAWFPKKNIETSFVLQNLLDDRHLEFDIDEGLQTRQSERGLYGQITWKF